MTHFGDALVEAMIEYVAIMLSLLHFSLKCISARFIGIVARISLKRIFSISRR